MHARFRPILVFERLLPGSRMPCRDAGTPSAARRSVVNAAGISTTRRQLSADHHLSRATKQHSITGEGLCRSAIAAEMLGAACSALQNANCTVCKTEPFGHHGNDV